MSPIKTLVLSGGAYNGLIELGVLSCLSKKCFYEIETIERIYGTSIGAFIAVLIALKMNWSDLIEYFIERPWHKLLSINPIELYTKKGAFDKQFFINALTPLFSAKSLDITTITFDEFKKYSNIDLFFYTIKTSTFEVCEISSKSHPDVMLIDAIYMTCCMPIAFRPAVFNGEHYIDGGIMSNYPLREAIRDAVDMSEFLGVTFDIGDDSVSINENSNIAEYIYFLFMKISAIREFNNVRVGIIPNEVVIKCAGINASGGYDVLFKRDSREEMVKQGESIAEQWLIDK